LALRRAAVERLRLQDRRVTGARLATFLATVAVVVAAVDTAWFSAWWSAVPAATFFALVLWHDRIIRERARSERAVRFYERGVARLDDNWAGRGNGGARFIDAAHPYAADLDVFGPGSLFELLCSARTLGGEQTLAAWLTAPASPTQVRDRQMAVAELRPRLDLREDLALLGDDVRAAFDPEELAAWAAAAALLRPGGLRLAAAAIVAAVAAALLAALAFGVGPLPLAVALTLEAGFAAVLQRRVSQVIRGAQHPDRELALFGALLQRLETESFTAAPLRRLRAGLDSDGEPPSRHIARLHRLIHLLDARKNQLFAPISGLLLWGTQIALAIEAWRLETGPAIGRWLETVSEVEALCALAGYAFEHPDDPFPEMVEGGPLLDAVGVGHPLIPEARCVRNDVRLGAAPRVLVVSGSNMSGKSTLLRSIGTNVILAQAGAPVRARHMRLSPLTVGASIRTLDSLQEGTSRFYAEITRIRQLMELANGPRPLLFLLDEILHGTNSHDRGIGAEAIVRGFLSRDAIGLVTTHDLALTRVADSLSPATTNVHFEDQMEDGVMRFDYRMRAGVVTHSNALALMRAIGLEV
jgi:hypothetical protein